MAWGSIELEPEVSDWLDSLTTEDFQHVRFYVELLRDKGVALSEPYSRQLDGKLRELRFHLQRRQVRITYWIAPGRRIILLTVFGKTRPREAREVERARRAMRTCQDREHTVGDGHDG
ncbi:MAG: type II toxin-antitoxin system RelE/ParE family toxin [Sporichthyaceae bacterium]